MFIIYFTISVGETANKFLVKSMEYCVGTFLVKSIEYYRVPVSHSEILLRYCELFIIYFNISVGEMANRFLVKSMEYCIGTFLVKLMEYYHTHVSHSDIL